MMGHCMINFVRFEYAYLSELFDSPSVIIDVWQTVSAWLATRGRAPTPAMLKRHNGTHYTGAVFNMDVEIFSLSFLRSETFRSFFAAIDCSGGIFVHRWANPIRSLAVWALLPESKVRTVAVLTACAAAPAGLTQFDTRLGDAPYSDCVLRAPVVYELRFAWGRKPRYECNEC